MANQFIDDKQVWCATIFLQIWTWWLVPLFFDGATMLAANDGGEG
jgi:hypothetical protein